MDVQVRGGNLLNFRGDALLLFHHSDVRPLAGSLALADWRLNAAVSILWKRKPELLKFGQLTVVAAQGKIPSDTIVLTGLGPKEEFSTDLRREGYRLALLTSVNLGVTRIAVQRVCIEGEEGDGGLEDLKQVMGSVRKFNGLKVSLFPDFSVSGAPSGSAPETAANPG